MALQGNVAVAPPGVRGLDCDTAVTAAQAQAYFNQGFRFCIRYVSRTDALRAGHAGGATPDLSEAEAAGILAAGMAVMAVQHPANVGWSPSADLGTAYGANAARYAAAAGLPAGVNLWLDLEGVAGFTLALLADDPGGHRVRQLARFGAYL